MHKQNIKQLYHVFIFTQLYRVYQTYSNGLQPFNFKHIILKIL
jgi:hypothetical protein